MRIGAQSRRGQEGQQRSRGSEALWAPGVYSFHLRASSACVWETTTGQPQLSAISSVFFAHIGHRHNSLDPRPVAML